MDIENLTLGDRVEYDHHLERGSDPNSRMWRKIWKRMPNMDPSLRKDENGQWYRRQETRTGIVVGIRQYQDGQNYDGDYGVEFVPDLRYPVVLVAFAMHRNPDAVLPVDLREVAA